MSTAPQTTNQDTLSLWDLIWQSVAILWKDWPKDMQIGIFDYNKQRFTLRGKCPHCLRSSVFAQITDVAVQDSRFAGHYRWIAGLQCQGCLRHILGIVDIDPSYQNGNYEIHYPVEQPNDYAAPEIPVDIAADFKEAQRCFCVSAYNATAEMCRRAVEASCIDLGAPKNILLNPKIAWLADQQKISPFLRDLAHSIRLAGNRAAHPDAAEEVIDQIKATAILKFTEAFFQYVYVIPKQLSQHDFSKPKTP